MKPLDIKASLEKDGDKKKFTLNISFPLFGYVVRRIFIFLPTLLAISLLTFILISAAPGDPAESMLNRNSSGGEGQASDKLASDKSYQDLRVKLGLDQPVFYISPGSLASCDTLNRIPLQEQRDMLDRMVYNYGNWKLIEQYYSSMKAFEMAVLASPRDSADAGQLIELRNNIGKIYIISDAKEIAGLLAKCKVLVSSVPVLSAPLTEPLKVAEASLDRVVKEATIWKKYVPAIHWNGIHNQYHRWLFGNAAWIGTETDPTKDRGFLRGDFGISFFTKRPVSSVIWDGLWITLLISVCIILIEYLVAIPLGVFSAVKKGTTFDSVTSTSLFVLYSLPSFWIGTMAIFFLCGGDYLNIFPPFGIGDTTMEDGFWVRAGDLSYHLILPLIVGSYGGLAFLSRQMRGGMLSVLRQDFIRTAYSKGVDQKKVIWSHALRNSLLPIITIFANVFPALIGGSLILEFLFTIPGLGQITYAAVLQKDYPMILTNTMFAAILTLFGYLIADILYAVADPRISYSSTKK
jgi:peptide/nickel transport system permease protein